MNAVRKILITAGLCLFVMGRLPAFEWPMEDVRIVSTFGQDQWGDYLKGIELYSPQSSIAAIDSGEVIFTMDEDQDGPHRMHSGLGNMVVLQHDRGIRSVYGHLSAPLEENIKTLKENQVFGSIGSSGMAEDNLLYLQIIDSEVSRFVNPLLSLPSAADTVRPNIDEIQLVNGSKAYSLQEGMRIRQGSYVVQLKTYDPSSATKTFRPTAVYSMKLYVNGEERQALSFESLAVHDWQFVPAGREDLPYDTLYAGETALIPGSIILQPGAAAIEIVVADFAGNERVHSVRVQVAAE